MFFCTLLINGFFKLINFKVTDFLNFTTACEVYHAVSIWQVSEPFSHIFFNWDKFQSQSLMVQIRTENFLKTLRMVAMACVDNKQKEVYQWVSFYFLYELIQHCKMVIEGRI